MREWMDNGCQLSWLLHASARTALIYRAGREVETIVAPTQLNGEGPVAGFTLDLAAIWNPGW